MVGPGVVSYPLQLFGVAHADTIRRAFRYRWIIILLVCLEISYYICFRVRLPFLTCDEARKPSIFHLQTFLLFPPRKSSWKSSALNEPTYFSRGTMKDLLRLTFGILGNVTALALFLAPLITFYKIVRRGSTEEFSGIPYVFTMLNCLLYAWYGLPFVTSHNLLLTTVNGAGAALEFIYVCIFLMYAPPKHKMKMLGIFMGVLAFFATVAVVSLLGVHHNARKLLVGSIATACCVCMYASPLSIMRLVIRTKSVQYMPFCVSLFVLLCGATWFLYGIFAEDAFVAAPNGIGASLGIAQLVLYFIYKDSAATMDAGANDEGVNGHKVEKPFSSARDETKGSSQV